MAEQFQPLGLPAVAVWGDSHQTIAETRFATSLPATCRPSSRSTSSTRASTFRTSTRCCCFGRPRARRCSCSSSGAACGGPPARRCAPSSTSSATTARSSASTGGCGRCSAAHAATSSGRSQRLPVPAGRLHLELDPVAQEIVLRSIREAIPSDWRERCDELRSLGDVNLATTSRDRSRARGRLRGRPQLDRAPPRGRLPDATSGTRGGSMLRAVGRLLHVDDDDGSTRTPGFSGTSDHQRRSAQPARPAPAPHARRSLTTRLRRHRSRRRSRSSGRTRRFAQSSSSCSTCCGTRGDLDHPLSLHNIPLALHARYTRTEILAAFDVGTAQGHRPGRQGCGGSPPRSRTCSRSRSTRAAAGSRRPRGTATTRSARAHPLGEPVRHAPPAPPASGTSASERRERTSSCSHDCERPIARSGVSGLRRTSATKANARSRSSGSSRGASRRALHLVRRRRRVS